MDSKKIYKAYCEGFYGNDGYRTSWQRYLALAVVSGRIKDPYEMKECFLHRMKDDGFKVRLADLYIKTYKALSDDFEKFYQSVWAYAKGCGARYYGIYCR